MILTEIFGNTARVKILEELISNWGIYLSIGEISRMSEVSSKTAYNQINKLINIGLLEKKEGNGSKFKLKEKDKRALALFIIDSEEFIRKSEEMEKFDMRDLNYRFPSEKIRTTFKNSSENVKIRITPSDNKMIQWGK